MSNESETSTRMILKKWNDNCEYCGNADDQCTMCHDAFQYEPADCPHGEDHARQYYRYADHDANTITVEYDCGLCGQHGVVARVETLTAEERAWNDLCGAFRKAYPEAGGEKIYDLVWRAWKARETAEVS